METCTITKTWWLGMKACCVNCHFLFSLCCFTEFLLICHPMPVLYHRWLFPCFVDCYFTGETKLKTNNACHFYITTITFGLGLPGNLGQGILIFVVSIVKKIVSGKWNSSYFRAGNSAHSLVYLWLQESNKTGEGLFFTVKVMFDCCWILFMYF